MSKQSLRMKRFTYAYSYGKIRFDANSKAEEWIHQRYSEIDKQMAVFWEEYLRINNIRE